VLSAEQVLAFIADNPHVMGVLDAGPCALQHVTLHVVDGPDERVDTCPCDRTNYPDTGLDVPLGGGQRISSPTHTIGDLVRDALPSDDQ
jgi:hypothetical protein